MCKYQSSEFNTNEVWETIGEDWQTEHLKLKAFLLLLFFTKHVVHFWIVNESDQIRTILYPFHFLHRITCTTSVRCAKNLNA